MNELSRGELVLAIDRTQQSQGAYYLVTPEVNISNMALQHFRSWILSEINKDDLQEELLNHCKS